MLAIDALDFSKGNGLVTVVTQDVTTGRVLMVAHADRSALEETLRTGLMHYFSRTRGAWFKGETSGHTQRMVSLELDCDGDAVLALVQPAGPACHNNTTSCFVSTGSTLCALSDTIEQRKQALAGNSYTAKLLADRNLRLKKLGEETTELVTALCDGDSARIAEEAADVLYHVLVATAAAGVTLDDMLGVLQTRAVKPKAAQHARTDEAKLQHEQKYREAS